MQVTVDYARKVVRAAPVHAVIGGLHLFELADDRLDWTGDQLKADLWKDYKYHTEILTRLGIIKKK